MSIPDNTATEKRDVYARVTDQIVTAIEDGAVARVGEIIGAAQDGIPNLAPSPSMERVREYIRASKAVNTLRGYQSDWRSFCAWCEQHGQCPLPALPETVAAYIAECALALKVGNIQRRLNAIAEAHKAVNLESPTHSAIVKNTMKGIRRTNGTSPAQKTAALTDDIRTMVGATDAGLIGSRDRAVILLGFAAHFDGRSSFPLMQTIARSGQMD